MAIRREWLDWSRPCIPQAAAWLIERTANGSRTSDRPERRHIACDLQHLTCVLPGQRAGRLLLEELIVQCDARRLALAPPRVTTPGGLLSSITADQPTASGAESCFAWMHALRRSDISEVAALLPRMPAEDDVLGWYELARMMTRVHADVAGGAITFNDVALQAEILAMEAEGRRWRALDHVFKHYTRVLHEQGLRDRHVAAQLALANPPSWRLALIAVPELNALQRQAIAAFGEQAFALIHAPESHHDDFDPFGCVDAGKAGGWKDRIIELDEEPIIVERPDDQAAAALRCIADLHGEFGACEIVIGLGDEKEGARSMQRVARWAGVNVHSPFGTPLTQTAPARVLRAIADWLDDPRFANFASLLRHPDVEHWVRPQISGGGPSAIDEWLTLLDHYFADHLHERLSGDWLCEGERRDRLTAAYRAVQRLLAPLSRAQPARQPLSAWSNAVLAVLADVYSTHEHVSDRTWNACLEWRDALASLASMPAALQPIVDAVSAIRLLLVHLHNEQTAVAEPYQPDQIELLGWLELHLDPAPVLIITGFNEGCVPHAAASDPFLPDSLRAVLGLPNREQRYARDAYLLEANRHCRERLSIILGRRAANGDPLAPSRLLLACDGDTLVNRIRQMCDEKHVKHHPRVALAETPRPAAKTAFAVPNLPALSPPQSMRVTDFRTYLNCPYRYALACLLRLESLGDGAAELDPLRFGDLAHKVLCDFGNDQDMRQSVNAAAIEKHLHAALDQRSKSMFGQSPMPAVQVQLARLKQRLSTFARFQAAHRNEGWLIQFCEHELRDVPLDVPDQEPMPVRGKIDRIDARDGHWLIVDYKTGDSVKPPEKVHLKDGEWKDLQLPLYEYLARSGTLPIPHGAAIDLGYICLPGDPEGACLQKARWTPEQIDIALEKAREVVRLIRQGVFDLKPGSHSDFDAFARICQTTVLRGVAEDEGGDDE